MTKIVNGHVPVALIASIIGALSAYFFQEIATVEHISGLRSQINGIERDIGRIQRWSSETEGDRFRATDWERGRREILGRLAAHANLPAHSDINKRVSRIETILEIRRPQ